MASDNPSQRPVLFVGHCESGLLNPMSWPAGISLGDPIPELSSTTWGDETHRLVTQKSALKVAEAPEGLPCDYDGVLFGPHALPVHW